MVREGVSHCDVVVGVCWGEVKEGGFVGIFWGEGDGGDRKSVV